MQKYTLSLLFVIFTLTSIKAQDIITKTDGETIECRIIEVTAQLVSYKDFDDLEGSIHSIWKKNVDKIKYGNGRMDFLQFQAVVDSNQQIIPLNITDGGGG
jgi:hypothetical protein